MVRVEEPNSAVDESVDEVQRRDPYARWVDPNSEWCFVDVHRTYPWVTLWERPPADSYIIYEMHVCVWCCVRGEKGCVCDMIGVHLLHIHTIIHCQYLMHATHPLPLPNHYPPPTRPPPPSTQIGSYTPEGTFAAAEAQLDHIADMGFSAIQLLPVNESTDKWGYSPKNLMAPHPAYGTPDQFRAFVDAAHDRGLAVLVDLTLHHGGAPGEGAVCLV